MESRDLEHDSRMAAAATALAGLMTYGRSAARLGNARRASVLARKPGVRATTVKKRTGYERGVYGDGVETRGDATLRPSAAFGARPFGRLGDVAYVHPDVKRAYPGIDARVRVKVVPDADWSAEVAAARKSLSEWSRGDTATGFYDHGNHMIAVRAQMPRETLSAYLDRADKTLAHELQHVAQELDGIRPPRRHPDYESYRRDGREVDARNTANRFWLTPEERVEMPRAATQDVKPEDVRQDAKGGKESPHRNFTNFLATDEVPDTIFGYPVVQDESRYTESDLKFFKENPKAAGFYDTGDGGEMDEDVPQQAVGDGAGDTRVKSATKNAPVAETADEPPRRYKVQPGDTLSRISKATKVPVADIVRYSKLGDPNRLKVGQTLWLVEPYPGSWNNPGNVKKGKAKYEGETGSVKSKVSTDGSEFLTFDTPENGLNAKGQSVGQMVREKIPQYFSEGRIPSADFTVSNLINVYAPPTDHNDTPGYVRFVAKRLGVDKDRVLDADDVELMASLLEAIAMRDSGPDKAGWFRRSDYLNAARKMSVPAKERR